MILIFGSSGHTRVVIDIVEKKSQHNIYGLIDVDKNSEKELMGYKIVGTEKDLKELISKQNISGGIIGIGDNWLRKTVRDKILDNFPDFNFLSCIHPKALIANDVQIGKGTVIMPGAIVNSGSVVHEHCILNTKCSIDHDSEMGEFSSLAPGATVGGSVKIGSYSAISLGANVLQNVVIGEHSVIGAGSLVNKNIGDLSVNYGIPARFIRTRNIGDKYL